MANTSMHLLIQLADNDANQQQKRLEQLNTEKNNAINQLDMLKQYREDYTNRLLQASQSGVSVANYHNFYRFIGTLDQAITQQTTVLAQFAHKIETQQQHWLAAKQRLNAYQTLQERRDQEQALQATRQEQRDNDELSAAMHYRLHHTNSLSLK